MGVIVPRLLRPDRHSLAYRNNRLIHLRFKGDLAADLLVGLAAVLVPEGLVLADARLFAELAEPAERTVAEGGAELVFRGALLFEVLRAGFEAS